jgi:hypothetical protein
VLSWVRSDGTTAEIPNWLLQDRSQAMREELGGQRGMWPDGNTEEDAMMRRGGSGEKRNSLPNWTKRKTAS